MTSSPDQCKLAVLNWTFIICEAETRRISDQRLPKHYRTELEGEIL